MDLAGRVLARARLSEGAAGMARLHALVGEHAGDGDDEDKLEVRVGIETDHGPWVTALVASGYAVFAVNPLQAARYRDRHSISGARSDTDDHRAARPAAHREPPGRRPAAGCRGTPPATAALPMARSASAFTPRNSSGSSATVPVQPVWWLAPMPAPLSPWKYS